MYFLHGTPQRIQLSSRAIQICRIPKVSFFVVLTETEILIYQIRPLTLISKITKSQNLFERHGKNKKIAVNSEYGIIAVATEKNYVAVYHFTLNASKPVLTPSPYLTRYDDGPGEIFGPIKCEIQYKLAMRYGGGLKCLEIQRDSIVYAADSAPIIQVSTLETTDPNKLWKVSSKQYDLREVTWFLDHSSLISRLYFDVKIDTFFWMSTDGRVYANIGVSSNTNTKSLFGLCVHNPVDLNKSDNDKDINEDLESKLREKKATVLSTNARFSLLYVGTADGTVYAYEIRDFGRQYVQTHSFKYLASSGKVNHIATTGDGHQVMVGYDDGWATLSPYLNLCCASSETEYFNFGLSCGFWDRDSSSFYGLGSKNFSSTGEAEGTGLSTPIIAESLKENDEFFAMEKENVDIQYLSQNDNTNDVLYSITDSKQFISTIYILPFLKSTIVSSVQSTLQVCGAQTSDRLYISKSYEFCSSVKNNFGIDFWDQVEYPQPYVASEWPIRYVSIKDDGSLIAIAGLHGLAIYVCSKKTWFLYKDANMEQLISVTCPMIWCSQFLLAGVVCESNFELHLYKPKGPLDDRENLAKLSFTSTIVTMSVCDEYSLVVYTADNFLHHIRFDINELGRLELDYLTSVNFAPIFTTPSRVRSITLLLPKDLANIQPSDLLFYAVLLVLINGKLVLLSLKKQHSTELLYQCSMLAGDVEFYFINGSQEIPSLFHSIWIMTGKGLKLWLSFSEILSSVLIDTKNLIDGLPKFLNTSKRVSLENFHRLSVEDLRSPSFVYKNGVDCNFDNTHLAKLIKNVNISEKFQKECIDLESQGCLLTVLSNYGLLLTAYTQGHKNLVNKMEYAHIQIGVYPFLPEIVRALLLSDKREQAIDLVKTYGHLHYINFVLEKLLSSSLLTYNSSQRDKLLYEVSLLFKDLQEFTTFKIVLGCLRKTEAEYWPMIFKYFGEPKDLMKKCLETEDVKSAAECLIIWQIHQGSASCASTFLSIYEMALKIKNWDVCTELSSYLVSLDPEKRLLKTALELLDEGPDSKDIRLYDQFNNLMKEVDKY